MTATKALAALTVLEAVILAAVFAWRWRVEIDCAELRGVVE